jgi:hypothetical protein
MDKLPKCFTSEDVLNIDTEDLIQTVKQPYTIENKKVYCTNYIEYASMRHTNVPRIIGIPHPKTYITLCNIISEYWVEINQQKNRIKNKISFTHVRYYKHSSSIFHMTYDNGDKYLSRKLELEYAIGANYKVKADIATCFPSMYSHSISWAIKGKANTKNNLSNKNKCGKQSSWDELLDQAISNLKAGETNGLLIGPHASNIISEIILNAVDYEVQKKHSNFIRHIDDYTYYAKSHADAEKFIQTLTFELKKFDLRLNDKKTSIEGMPTSIDPQWKVELNLFQFDQHDKYKTIQINSILSFIDYSLNIHKKFNKDSAILKYAIKMISGCNIYRKHLYIVLNRLFHLIIQYPYLVTLLEDVVFKKYNIDVNIIEQSHFKNFINCLFDSGIEHAKTESVAYASYFAIKYKYKITINRENIKAVINFSDCIVNVLLFHYAKEKYEYRIGIMSKTPTKEDFPKDKDVIMFDNQIYYLNYNDNNELSTLTDYSGSFDVESVEKYLDSIENNSLTREGIYNPNKDLQQQVVEFVKSLKSIGKNECDKYWLLAYECLNENDLNAHDEFLYYLKGKGVNFVKF